MEELILSWYKIEFPSFLDPDSIEWYGPNTKDHEPR